MLKSILLLGVGFSLGYAKALHDSGDIKEVLETFRNDEELKTAFKDLTEALKRVRESDQRTDGSAATPPISPEPGAPTPPTIT
jgi:hypothetical protein